MARLDITSAAFHNDVHGTLTRLRHETAVASGKLFLVRTCYFPTRYADVDRLLHDGLLVKNGSNARSAEGKSTKLWMPPVFDAMMHNMLTSDEPDHRRLRNLVHKAFTPKRIAALDGLIERIADELLDELLRAGGGDLFTTFAQPLPVRIIAELIGIPAQDRDKFVRWTQAIARNPTPLSLLPVMVALRKFLAYIDALAEQRRRVPEDDLLTALVEAEAEGDRLTRQELRSTVLILLIAGHETTVNLIANGTLALLRNPEQLALLREQPELMASAVEELLRYEGPLITTEISYAKQTIELDGAQIPQGAMVLPLLMSANHDEQVFTEPGRLDITRNPNRHLAFGRGFHYCLGAPLARLEAKIAFARLLERAPKLRLAAAPEQIRFKNVLLLHKLEALPVAL